MAGFVTRPEQAHSTLQLDQRLPAAAAAAAAAGPRHREEEKNRRRSIAQWQTWECELCEGVRQLQVEESVVCELRICIDA